MGIRRRFHGRIRFGPRSRRAERASAHGVTESRLPHFSFTVRLIGIHQPAPKPKVAIHSSPHMRIAAPVNRIALRILYSGTSSRRFSFADSRLSSKRHEMARIGPHSPLRRCSIRSLFSDCSVAVPSKAFRNRHAHRIRRFNAAMPRGRRGASSLRSSGFPNFWDERRVRTGETTVVPAPRLQSSQTSEKSPAPRSAQCGGARS